MQQASQNKILVPSDFSDFFAQTWATALSFAKAYHAEIVLLNVVEPPRIRIDFEEEVAVKDARKMAADYVQTHKLDEEVSISTLVKVGKPYKKIIEAALEIDPLMIVMGTSGADGLEEFFIGSNASRVIRSAPCPVVTIRYAQKDYVFNKVLLPLDLTKETTEKIAKAAELADKFKASIHLVSVQPPNEGEGRERLEKQMQNAQNYLKAHGVEHVTAEIITSEDEIGPAIVHYARQIEVDLICIMTQQEKRLREYFLGTQAEHFVNHSPFPVLSIRPQNLYVALRAGSIFG
ncbi:MAG: universal stress protein [Bacteroidia bacterium]